MSKCLIIFYAIVMRILLGFWLRGGGEGWDGLVGMSCGCGLERKRSDRCEIMGDRAG